MGREAQITHSKNTTCRDKDRQAHALIDTAGRAEESKKKNLGKGGGWNAIHVPQQREGNSMNPPQWTGQGDCCYHWRMKRWRVDQSVRKQVDSCGLEPQRSKDDDPPMALRGGSRPGTSRVETPGPGPSLAQRKVRFLPTTLGERAQLL